MTPEEFYQRIDQEREEMSLAEFLGEFEGITPKMIGQFLGYRTKRLLPSVRTLIALEDLFTAEEMREILTAKMSRERLDEPKKVVVPKFVAEHIEYLRGLNSPMRDLFSIAWIDSNELAQWLYNEPGADDMLARAWLDGYEVEQEKLYTVEIPNPNWTHHKDCVTGLVKRDDGIVICQTSKPSKLTEAEIRKDFEWAWQAGFAKEVV